MSQLENYLPPAAVDCLKKTDAWGMPFKSSTPTGMRVIGEGGLPKGYNKLDFSFSDSLHPRLMILNWNALLIMKSVIALKTFQLSVVMVQMKRVLVRMRTLFR